MNAVHTVAVVGLLALALSGLWLLFTLAAHAAETRRKQRVRSAVDEFYRNQQTRTQTDELAMWREARAAGIAAARRRHPTGRDAR